MPDPKIVQLPFGPGLDKETGAMVVRPQSMQDLRNVYHHEGSIVVRSGTEKTNDFFDGEAGWTQYGQSVGTGDPATHILAGIAIRSERVGIVVSWEDTYKRVAIWRVDALGGNSLFLGFWPHRYSLDAGTANFTWSTFDGNPPKVVLAEIYGMVFFAHDEKWDAFRADTYVYDPWKDNDEHYSGLGNTLGPVYADLVGDPDLELLEVIRFRGVARHLEYLFGWGWGLASGPDPESRPEMLRVSQPGDPKSFDPDHYFVVGDKRDPVISAAPARQTLIVCKETDSYQVIGYSRATFGIRPYDQLYGALASRLMVPVSGDVYTWSAEGPMVGGDVGPFSKMWIPLDLAGFEPATLVPRVEFDDGWGDYIDEIECVIFCFGRRAYVLSLRNPQDPRWTYWELGKKAFCGFRLYGDDGDIGDIPTGDPTINSITYDVEDGCAQSQYTVNVDNSGQGNADLIELWHRPQGPFWIQGSPMPTLGYDSDGDGVPSGWTRDVNTSGDYYTELVDGGVRLSLDMPNTVNDHLQVYWDTSSVTVGNRYRFEAYLRGDGHDIQLLTVNPAELRMDFLGAADAILQSHRVRWPDSNFYKMFVEGTAPGGTLKIRFSCRLESLNAGGFESIRATFRSPVWFEEDSTNPGAWVRAWPMELVGPEANRDLPPASVTEPGMDYDIAVRYVNVLGQAGTLYADPDPTTWPAGAQDVALTEMAPPGFFRASYIQEVPGPLYDYMSLEPGCVNDLPTDPGEGVSYRPPAYTNRDIEIWESVEGGASALLFTVCRGVTILRRRILELLGERNKTYNYGARYLGPDRNSGYGPPVSLYASGVPGDPDPLPPTFSVSKQSNGAYYIYIELEHELNDIDGDGVPDPGYPVGVEIWDNWDAATQAIGAMSLKFFSCTWGGGGIQFPDNNVIDHGKNARAETLEVQVREFFKAGEFYGWTWPPCGTSQGPSAGTDWGPWADIQEVTV